MRSPSLATTLTLASPLPPVVTDLGPTRDRCNRATDYLPNTHLPLPWRVLSKQRAATLVALAAIGPKDELESMMGERHGAPRNSSPCEVIGQAPLPTPASTT
jgi:hypothetical protein